MIKKTLVITLQEKDPNTKEVHDIFQLKRGDDKKVLLEFANPSGKLLVDKQDLYEGIRELELFYGDKKSKFDIPVNVEISSGLSTDSVLVTKSTTEESVLQVNNELEAAQKDTYFVVEHGDDNS